jgi:hypothetical protein
MTHRSWPPSRRDIARRPRIGLKADLGSAWVGTVQLAVSLREEIEPLDRNGGLSTRRLLPDFVTLRQHCSLRRKRWCGSPGQLPPITADWCQQAEER